MNRSLALFAILFLGLASAMETEMVSGRNIRSQRNLDKISISSSHHTTVNALHAREKADNDLKSQLSAAEANEKKREKAQNKLEVQLVAQVAALQVRINVVSAAEQDLVNKLAALAVRVAAQNAREAQFAKDQQAYFTKLHVFNETLSHIRKRRAHHSSSSSRSGRFNHRAGRHHAAANNNVQIQLSDDAQQTNDGNNVANSNTVVDTSANSNSNSGTNQNGVFSNGTAVITNSTVSGH